MGFVVLATLYRTIIQKRFLLTAGQILQVQFVKTALLVVLFYKYYVITRFNLLEMKHGKSNPNTVPSSVESISVSDVLYQLSSLRKVSIDIYTITPLTKTCTTALITNI